ncbi:MAG: hypothetical protein COA41_04425 [Sphingopyxis sp.]|nr:MAG: hypothetical protein COA41_04425 [Sphingopyxis sp.]
MIETRDESHAVSEFSILVVEDNAMLSLAMEDILRKLGWTNLEFAYDLSSALEITQKTHFSLVFLDIDLNGKPSLPVARQLRQNEVPWFFTTGFGSRFDFEELKDAPIIRKPYSEKDIEQAILQVQARNP